MAIFAALSFLAESASVIEWPIAPWRYLLSARYRHRKHGEWNGSPMRQLAEVLAGICGFVFGITIVWLCIRFAMR